MLSTIAGEYGITQEPELRWNDSGNAWLKIRGKAADRAWNAEDKRWEDKGDPCYVDIIVGGKAAEHLYESVTIGDAICVVGKLNQREWTDSEGAKRQQYQIRADVVGVCVSYGPARTKRAQDSVKSSPLKEKVTEDEFAAPF